MPDQRVTSNAARFVLSLDGDVIGDFEVLIAATASHAAPRLIQPHELPLVFEHGGEFRPAKVSLRDHHFELPGTGTQPTLVLKRAASQPLLIRRGSKLANPKHSARITLAAVDAAGRTLARHDLGTRPLKITAPALQGKGAGDIAIEEIVIDHEGVRLEPAGSNRRIYHHKP
ncbi:MAG TPA: hypothetical protein VKB34_16580 [Povalibacter sp.]|nr:hypothetical protein [Povalibacter sp.]